MINKPTKAQEQLAEKISHALKISLPCDKTRQAYWEYINKHIDAYRSAPAQYTVNGVPEKGVIVLSFDRIPKNCGDCGLYFDSEWYDEDAFFGDGIRRCCPLGGSTFDCMKVRPANCPIKKVK